MAAIQSLQAINAGKGVEKREPSYTVGGSVNWCSHYGKPYGGFSKKLGYNSAIPFLGILPKKTKTQIRKDARTSTYCSIVHNSQDMGVI